MNGTLAVLMVASVIAVGGCSDSSERSSATDDPSGADETATTPTSPDVAASGPDGARGDVVHRMGISGPEFGLRRWNDARDASLDWVDVTSVSVLPGGQPHWTIELAARQPKVADVEPGLVIAYGLDFDADGDAVPDYRVSIDNDTPRRGDLRVQVVDFATGEVKEQLGPLYGYPVEFSHPGEPDPPPAAPPSMVFTFLSGSKPAGLKPKLARFYAWTSATRDGKLVAEDYAPDRGWMTAAAP